MTVTTAGGSAERMRRKRERARAAGLCIACCGSSPPPGRTICAACNEAAHRRSRARRTAAKATRQELRRLTTIEALGDAAMVRCLYEEAIRCYREVLESAALVRADHARVSEKLGNALLFGADPSGAKPWFERALEAQSGTESAERAVGLLLQIDRQNWLNSRTQESLPLYARIVGVAMGGVSGALRRRVLSRAANNLTLLGRYEEALPYLERADRDSAEEEPADIGGIIAGQRAIVAASFGQADAAFELFEHALQAAREQQDGYLSTIIWDDYALWALALGDTAVAVRCRERALLVARQQNIAWRVPYLSLRYVDVLQRLGQLERAKRLLDDALTHDFQMPGLRCLLASAGMPTALALGDADLLERCKLPDALELAYRSGEEVRIAATSAAFVALYLHEGATADARDLLARALRRIRHADLCWDILLAAARVGVAADIARARQLFVERSAQGSNVVSRAMLQLFDAIVARRGLADANAVRLARRACAAFESLQWYRYADIARALSGDQAVANRAFNPTRPPEGHRPLSEIAPSLTPRENEVAELILLGMSNRQIAAHLFIAEHTVESHVSSILARLGIHSRWQLGEIIGGTRDSSTVPARRIIAE